MNGILEYMTDMVFLIATIIGCLIVAISYYFVRKKPK